MANEKLWGGRFQKDTDALVESYTASISFDQQLAAEDLAGSRAHVRMLGQCGILPAEDVKKIIEGLNELEADLREGKLRFSVKHEDIHMNLEYLLTERIGSVAGKLHTGRSRNDQVATDMHLYLRNRVDDITELLRQVQQALLDRAEQDLGTIIPGYTHLQRAQPILLSHHWLAYFWMFERDIQRLRDARKRINWLPLGAGALAGTTFPIDQQQVATELGFDRVYPNSLDAVSDRDFILEFLSAASMIMVHISRLCEELIIWSSHEFGFIELDDAYCTGSSIMPQKKNPDVAELLRGKTGRVVGHLVGLLTTVKGLPLAYNKDMQEDKEGMFDTVATLTGGLPLLAGMLATLVVRGERIQQMRQGDYSNATDLADYLVRKDVPFREAHAIVGRLVYYAIEQQKNLEDLTLAEYQQFSPAFADDVYRAIAWQQVVDARDVYGGTATRRVAEAIKEARRVWSGDVE